MGSVPGKQDRDIGLVLVRLRFVHGTFWAALASVLAAPAGNGFLENRMGGFRKGGFFK